MWWYTWDLKAVADGLVGPGCKAFICQREGKGGGVLFCFFGSGGGALCPLMLRFEGSVAYWSCAGGRVRKREGCIGCIGKRDENGV